LELHPKEMQLLDLFPGLCNETGKAMELKYTTMEWTVRQSVTRYSTTGSNLFQVQNEILLGCDDQPGCDMLFKDMNGVHVGVVCNSSKVKEVGIDGKMVEKRDATTPLTNPEVTLTWESFSEEMKALNVTEFVLVFIVKQMRDPKLDLSKIPSQVIIIDPKRFERFFGPTFSQRPLYLYNETA